MIRLWSLFALFFFPVSIYCQDTIREYKAKDNLYFVGDRTFSAYYICEEYVVVIDPISPLIAEETLRSIRKKTDLPVRYVFYSHNHWDHIGGGRIYKEQGAIFIAHEEAAKNITPKNGVIIPDSTWTGAKKQFKFGKLSLEAFYYGFNHGSGMTVFRFPEHNAVFCVDLVVPDRVLYAYLPDSKPRQWLSHLNEISKLPFEDFYMAHVRPLGTREDLKMTIAYFTDLYAATDAAIEQNIPLFDIPTKVKLPKYEQLQNYEEWLHLNVWRILMEKSIGQ